MTIPAFTPEASLDLSGQTCRAQAWSRGHAKGAVQPASCIGQCFQECLAYHPPSKVSCNCVHDFPEML